MQVQFYVVLASVSSALHLRSMLSEFLQGRERGGCCAQTYLLVCVERLPGCEVEGFALHMINFSGVMVGYRTWRAVFFSFFFFVGVGSV